MLPRPLQLKIWTSPKSGGGSCFIKNLPAKSSQPPRPATEQGGSNSCHCRVILSLIPPVLGREVHSPFDVSSVALEFFLSFLTEQLRPFKQDATQTREHEENKHRQCHTARSSVSHAIPPQLRVQRPRQMPSFLSASMWKRPLSTRQQNSLPRTLNSFRFRSQRTRPRDAEVHFPG